MYIRWLSKKRNRPEFGRGDADIAWQAILVESVRINEKPRQKHIAYIGGFTESAVKIPAQRRLIWDRITDKLDNLADRLSRDDRWKIESAISEKIGKPPRTARNR